MRIDELAPSEQAQIRRGAVMPARSIAAAVTAARPRRSVRAGRWTCGRCGQTFTAYAAAERHVDVEHGAGRIGCVL